ncbi:hypothetical protein PCAR4_1000010 [Paraburkholderia caribensis]|jgi:hypothetical protein|nr:hypothetical protein PCAR4_1000010 [Paraburkholderia caribensis]
MRVFLWLLRISGKKVEVSINDMNERLCALNFGLIEPLEKKQRHECTHLCIGDAKVFNGSY